MDTFCTFVGTNPIIHRTNLSIGPLMSVTRKNHYVPQWHQERFFAHGKSTHILLDLTPPTFKRGDGTVASGRCLFDSPSSRAFVAQDLYSTFFVTAQVVNHGYFQMFKS